MINELNKMWKETIVSMLLFYGTIFFGYFCFFLLKWGENVFLGTTIVNASIVPEADNRRLNEYRKPTKK
jgi:hypothetical protein